MKNKQALIRKICTMCMALGGIWYWEGMSLLFFGEPKYPEQTEK